MAYQNLNEALADMADSVRQFLKARDVGSQIILSVEIKGMVQTGEWDVTFKADHSSYYGTTVKGRTMNEAVRELCRRMDWDKQATTPLLTGPLEEAPAAPATEEF